LGVSAAAIVIIGIFWFGRDTTSSAAPQGTAIVLHFNPNRLTWGSTEDALGDITLISNRSMKASDIQMFAKGEFSIFIADDGTRSVSIRTTAKQLPTAELDAQGILVEETSRGIYLLSDRPVARMDWYPSHVWFGCIHWPGVWHIGDIHIINEESTRGPIFSSKNQTRIRLPKQELTKLPERTLPDGTMLALAMPLLPNINISGVTSAIDSILSSLQIPMVSLFAEHLLEAPGKIILANSQNQIDFLFTSDSEKFDKNQQQKVIQAAAALKSPRLRPFVLPDDSIVKEIIVDPSLTTVEETTVAGILVSRVAMTQGEYLYAAESDGSFIITNKLELLEFELKGKTDGVQSTCAGNVSFLSLTDALRSSSSALKSRATSQIALVGEEYRAIAVNQGWIYSNIRLCH